MGAISVYDESTVFNSGHIIEIVVWRLPEPVPGSNHYYKYRLFFGLPGQRLVGYDNERGKGDHKHIGNKEYPYQFTGIAALLWDFRKDVAEWNNK